MKERKTNALGRILVFALSLVMIFGAVGAVFGISAAAASDPISTFDDGYELHANWIWADAPVYSEQWVSMRKTFTLDEVPEEAFARISADTKYWLWINGEMAVFEGQLKLGETRYDWYYDKEDISDYLVEGENTIAALVYYAGKVSATTVNSGVPAFLFEAEIGDTLVTSDTTWRAVIDPAYEDAGFEEHGSLGESSTRYNATLEMTDPSGNRWVDKDYDDSSWAYAVNQDDKIRTNRMKNNEGGNNKIYYQNSDPRRQLVLRSIPRWSFYDLKTYTEDGRDGTGQYTYEKTDFAPLSLPKEYVLEAEVSVGESTAAAIGLCVCFNDSSNFYMMQIGLKRSGSSAYDGLIFKPHTMSGGSWKSSTTDLRDTEVGKTVYDPESSVDNRFNTKHTVRVEVSESAIKTYLNGYLLGTFTDTKLAREGSTVGFRQDVDEILKVYSYKVTDMSGNEIYNADIDERAEGSAVPEFSNVHIENGKNEGTLAKVASNAVSKDANGDSYVTVRNCRVGVSNGNATVTYKFTNETNQQGTPYLKVRSKNGGELISIVSDSWKETSIRHQYVTKAGEQVYEAFGWMNGYVFTFTIPESVEVIELGFRPSGYKTVATGMVTTDNDVLNKIYQEAYDTLYICMRDTYMDCPDRERSQWWGDTVSNMQQAAYAMDENAALLYTKTLKQVIGFVKQDGALPSKVANGKDDLELPMQSLAGVHSFWQYYLYTGNSELLIEAYPYLLDYLDMWSVSVNGVTSHRAGNWDWFDWGDNPDMAIIENCWYYLALDCVLKIADLDNSGATAEDIEFLTSRMERMEKNFDAMYWDEGKNAYYNETANGKADDRANALAVYSGLADKTRYEGMLSVLTGTYNASPYMEKYVLESMYLMDATDEALARTLERYTPLAEDGYPTLTEYWVMRAGGTNNHAWTGGPLSMLYMYNAGITPLTPNFETFKVRPQLGSLTSVNAYTVQGCGTIEVVATRSATEFVLQVIVPEGAKSAIISVPRIEDVDTMVTLGGAVLYSDGRASATLPQGVSYAGEDVSYVSFEVTPGTYTFTASENVSETADSYSLVIGEAENATVTVNGAKVTSFPYTYTAKSGSDVTVVVTPDNNYRIVAFTGSEPETVISRNALTRSYTLSRNMTVNAVTEEAEPEAKKVSISVSDKEMALYAITAYVDGNVVSLPYKSVYPEGTKVNLTIVSASEDNYTVTVNGKETTTIDFITDDDVNISVGLEEKSTVTEHKVNSVTVSKKSSNDTSWDEINLYDGIRISSGDSLGYSTGFGTSTTSVSITYDLGSVQCVNQIALFPRTDATAEDFTLSCNFPVDFTVSVSEDGSAYTTALVVTDNPNPKFKQQSFDLGKVYNARYVRLTVTKVGLSISGQTSSYIQIAEFDVYYNSLLSESDDNTSSSYGPIPEKYADAVKYPFALFGDGAFVGAYTHWANTDDKDTDNGGTADNNDVIQYAKNLVSGAGGAGKVAYILLRSDYALDSSEYSVKDGVKVNEFFGNFSQIGGTIVVDLGGNSLTLGAEVFLNAEAKLTSGVAHDTAMKFMNGTVELNPQPLINYRSNSKLTTTKSFDFAFENVTFVLNENTKGASLVSQGSFSGSANVSAKIDFIDCTFDYSKVSSANAAFTLFDLNDAELEATVTVKGGRIIANENSFAAITVATLGKNGKVNFATGKNGSYAELYMPEGESVADKAIPTDLGDKYFIRTGKTEIESEAYAVYSLIDKAFTEYAPKMSITLHTQLTLNVYIPAECTEKFTFNGVKYENLKELSDKTVTLSDGKSYYLVSVSLASAEAASEIKLTASVKIDGKSATANYTFSVPKYSAKLIANGNDTEKALGSDVLAYIKAAYEYFDTFNTTEEIERVTALVDSIIGDYSAVPETSGVTNTAAPVTKVTLVLDEKPTIRFYVTDTNVSFYLDGKKLNTVSGVDEKYGAYVELDVYAYALAETITYGNGGSYHISDFVNGAKGTDCENLVNAFVKYVESAANYRNSVVNK